MSGSEQFKVRLGLPSFSLHAQVGYRILSDLNMERSLNVIFFFARITLFNNTCPFVRGRWMMTAMALGSDWWGTYLSIKRLSISCLRSFSFVWEGDVIVSMVMVLFIVAADWLVTACWIWCLRGDHNLIALLRHTSPPSVVTHFCYKASGLILTF